MICQSVSISGARKLKIRRKVEQTIIGRQRA
jgi:hypothetical protein